MGWRNDEKTDWQQALGNLHAIGEATVENHQRLARGIASLEHLVAVLLAEIPDDCRDRLARQLRSDAQRLSQPDVAQESLLRLAAVLHSRTDEPDAQAEPHKALEHGFHRLPELPWVRRTEN